MFYRSTLTFFGRRLLPSVANVIFSPDPAVRYRRALKMAKAIEPIAKTIPRYRMPVFALGTYREYLTTYLLQSMTRRGIRFDPEIEMPDAELVPRGGAIFISGHFYLNFLFLRWLHDAGRPHAALMITETDEWLELGTDQPLGVLRPEKASLLQMRRLVARGEMVMAAIDDATARPEWKKLDVEERNIFVSDALFRFAERTQTPIYFFDTYFDADGRITTRIVPAVSTISNEIFGEFNEFIREALARRKWAR